MAKFFYSFLLIIFCGYILYGQDQNDTLNQLDTNGQKTGYWKKYNESGLILYEGRFEADIPVGEFRYFYPDGKTKAKSLFSENGSRSVTTTYHYSGKVMSEGFYNNKQKDSLWKYYNINGIFLKEEFYRNNQKNGVWKTYYQDGQIAEETHWEDGKMEGPWIQYFYDGKIKLEGTYLNDKIQGQVTHYFPSGRTRITGQYDQSYRSGTWYYMNDSSKVIKMEYYENGKLVNEENFDPE